MAASKIGRLLRSAKRTWVIVGGLAGAITILGLVVAFGGLVQDYLSGRSADAAQATMIALGDAQLRVQQEIATFQASDVRTGPTATAISARVVHLESTQEALEAQRRQVSITLTAIAPETTAAPTSGQPAAYRSLSQVPGIRVELTDFSHFENTLTVRLRFTNSGEEAQLMHTTLGSYLLDEATHNRYRVFDQSNQSRVTLPPGDSIEVWAKYELPAEEKPSYLTLVLPNSVLFEHLEVP